MNPVPALSTYAADIDNLILLIAVLVGFWFFLCEAIFFYFIVRYRKRDGQKAEYITGDVASEKRWVSYPHYAVLVFDVLIIVFAIQVWVNVKQTLPDAAARVRVVGQQWAWSFQHPGPDGTLDTADDIRTVDDLHVEVNKVYHYELEARDVLHSFSVPVFRLKQDAIPGRRIVGWFEATGTGTYDIQCAEICGIGHGVMVGRIVIETPEEHQAWMAKNAAAPAATAPSAAE
jgi:cytochrome c oxidase subunit II